MKKGLEYQFSAEKRGFDLAMAAALWPAAFTGRILLGFTHSEPALFNAVRIGNDNVPFAIHKLRTLDSQTGEPFGKAARWTRRLGVDELAQVRNIRRGEMAIAGRRPLPLDEHEAVLENAAGHLVDRWRRIVLPTLPGMASSFAILNHATPELIVERADMKLELDIKDVIDGSLVYDSRLFQSAVSAALRGET